MVKAKVSMNPLNLPKKRLFENSASIWKRILAYLIDMMLINIIIIDRFKDHFNELSSLDFTQIITFVNTNQELIAQIATIEAVISVLILFYFIIFEYKFERTPGKMIMKFFVKDKTKKKAQLTFQQVFIRSIFKIPFSIFGLLMFVDVVHYMFRKERLGDKLANTIVTEVIST